MKSKQIEHINEALLVLRHFIDLSARLLPFLDELQRKHKPTISEIVDKKKILDVYRNYQFDTRTSEMLLNSNILELIQNTFENAEQEAQNGRRRRRSNRALRRFLQEHERLSQNWGRIDAN